MPSQLPKKKSLSLMIGPPSVAPGIVRRFFGLFVAELVRLEDVLRAEDVVVVIDEGRAVELVGARLGDYLDGRAAGQPLLGVEVVRRDVDLLDRLGRGT